MQEVRLVVNITKIDPLLRINNIKIVVENREEGTQLSSMRSLNIEVSNATALFSAIQTSAVEVFNSALNS